MEAADKLTQWPPPGTVEGYRASKVSANELAMNSIRVLSYGPVNGTRHKMHIDREKERGSQVEREKERCRIRGAPDTTCGQMRRLSLSLSVLLGSVQLRLSSNAKCPSSAATLDHNSNTGLSERESMRRIGAKMARLRKLAGRNWRSIASVVLARDSLATPASIGGQFDAEGRSSNLPSAS